MQVVVKECCRQSKFAWVYNLINELIQGEKKKKFIKYATIEQKIEIMGIKESPSLEKMSKIL